MESSVYSDLFDDGMSSFNFLLDDLTDEVFEKNLLNTIRFQVLLAILFERKITVPETWLASSSLFLRVFDEVCRNYPTKVMRDDGGGDKSVLANLPFSFVLFGETQRNPATSFMQMLSKRLASNRRICWLPTSEELSEADEKTAKIAISQKIDTLIRDKDGINAITADYFGENFSYWLEDIYGASNGANFGAISLPISNFLKHIESDRGRRVTSYWGEEGEKEYRQTMGRQVGEIQKIVFQNEKSLETHPEQTQEFRDFFIESESKQVPFHDVMGMWNILQNYSSDVQITVEAFGRLAVNTGYACSTSAVQSTLSFDYYGGEKNSEFTNQLMQSLLKNQMSSNQKMSANQFVEVLPTAQYDLADTIEWRNIWREAAEISQNAKWRLERDKIEVKILRLSDDDDFGDDEWNNLFDSINGQFQDIQFELYQRGERPIMRILKNEKSNYPAIESLQDYVVAAINLTGAATLFNSAAELFASKLPTEKSFKLIRKMRKTSGKENPIVTRQNFIASNVK